MLDGELSLFSHFHAHDTNIPAFDDLTNTNVDLESFFVDRAVKNRSIFKTSSVIDKNFLTFLDIGAVFTDLDNFLDDTPIISEVNNVANLLLWLLNFTPTFEVCLYHLSVF